MAAKKRERPAPTTRGHTDGSRMAEPPWSAAEMGCGHLGDARLDRRLQTLVAQLSTRMGASIPFACQDWAATKAAYRF